MTAPATIDDYLKGVSADRRLALERLRKQIRSLVPDAEECISYSMPAFRWGGHVVAGFLATNKGCSYFPFSGTTLDGMADELKAFSRTKSALHFDPARGLPLTLLRKLIKARQSEFAAKPAKHAKPAKPAMHAKPAKPVMHAKPAKHAKPAMPGAPRERKAPPRKRKAVATGRAVKKALTLTPIRSSRSSLEG